MSFDAVLENVRLAVACGAEPGMALAVALATARPQSAEEAFALLDARREDILRVMADRGTLRRLATLEPEITREPELGRLRLDIGDHELRGRLLFGEILGKKSFVQLAAWVIAGLDLSPSDAELLEQVGIICVYGDPQIWPLTVARRAGVRGAGLSGGLIAGVAAMCTPHMTAQPLAGFMRFLDRVEAEMATGRSLDDVVAKALASREKIPGVRRPVTGVDERVPPLLATFERFGRAGGPSLQLMHRLDAAFEAQKGLRLNAAAPIGAVFRDIGFTPRAAGGFSMIYFVVPLLAQVVFGEEIASAKSGA